MRDWWSNDETNFLHKLLLINRKVSRLRKTYVKHIIKYITCYFIEKFVNR